MTNMFYGERMAPTQAEYAYMRKMSLIISSQQQQAIAKEYVKAQNASATIAVQLQHAGSAAYQQAYAGMSPSQQITNALRRAYLHNLWWGLCWSGYFEAIEPVPTTGYCSFSWVGKISG